MRRGTRSLADCQAARPPAGHRYLASIAAHLAVRNGDIRQALAFGEQALATANSWVAILATAFLVPSLIDEHGETAPGPRAPCRARPERRRPAAGLPQRGAVRPRLPARRHRHKAAVTDLLGLGAVATSWASSTHRDPLAFRRRAVAAPSATLQPRAAWPVRRSADQGLTAGDRGRAPSDGAGRGRRARHQAVIVLRSSTAPQLELARAHCRPRRRPPPGGRQGHRPRPAAGKPGPSPRAGRRRASQPRQARRPRQGRPRSPIRRRDSLTPSELRVAELAAAGTANRPSRHSSSRSAP